MKNIAYKAYFDKVYGCMIGKCVSGTAGAPYEGMKQPLSLRFTPETADTTLPNDDLDLQVLWLDALEEKGEQVDTEDLAGRFLQRCPYSPGEYAIFKKNYRRGIHPPYSGSYGNHYYLEGMGCPIRSEIWACIAPGDSALAARLCLLDGTMDHAGNSVWAQQFLAALEALAFFESDIKILVNEALKVVPQDSRFYALVRDVMGWRAAGLDAGAMFQKLNRGYGHPDCTNMFQNLGIILIALLYSGDDLLKATETAVNFGYDTDCTGATVGAIVGLILGAAELERRYGFTDQTYTLGVQVARRSNRISDLAEDICRVGVHFSQKGENPVGVTGSPLPPLAPPAEVPPPLVLGANYHSLPVVAPGQTAFADILVCGVQRPLAGRLAITSQTLECSVTAIDIKLAHGEELRLTIGFSLPGGAKAVQDTNLVELAFTGDGVHAAYTFGFAGAACWTLYGPYWENYGHIEKLVPGTSYMDQLERDTPDATSDSIRNYHISAHMDTERQYMDMKALSLGQAAPGGEAVCTLQDRFELNEVMGYRGPCTIYLTRQLISPEDRTCRMDIGHSDGFELWVNGEKLASRQTPVWWTNENVHLNKVHLNKVHLNKGVNHIALRLDRHSAEALFSLCFLQDEEAMLGPIAYPEHLVDMASGLPG